MTKQAVILAAGRGSRLQELGADSPKCLLDLNGRKIIEMQIQNLFAAGVTEICVVTGYKSSLVHAAVAKFNNVSCIENLNYATTNSLYSLNLTREWVKGSFICVNGDVVAHPEIFKRVAVSGGCALAFDSQSGQDDEHMKIKRTGPRLNQIGKNLDQVHVEGENVGILQFGGQAAKTVFDAADHLLATNGVMHWAPAVLNELVADNFFHCVDISDLPWIEVDFPTDLFDARTAILPAITNSLAPSFPQQLQKSQEYIISSAAI
ncbi:MAG: phosphocholine cytidylyltransferase family protein [Planctomycetes bacterium]|nr:phosphocholine cytidylyltransferase family protein [Planctomycetota bacterium]